MQHRCVLRTAPEEFNLAANVEPHDVLAAEFKRTYRSVSFPGGRLLRLYDAAMAKADGSDEQGPVRLRAIPVRKGSVGDAAILQYDIEDVYGYRGRHPRVYYLSPWEFLMYWKPVRYDETNANAKDVIMFPDTTLLKVFRFEWMLLRTERPYVPQPEGTPMPDREKTADGKAKLFSIYLRPWVLEKNEQKTAYSSDKKLNPVAIISC